MADGRAVFQVDLKGSDEGGQKRILAAMAVDGDRVWFFKLMGPTARLEKHKAEFDQFVPSLRFNAFRNSAAEKGNKDGLAWTKPIGWEYGGEVQFRVLTMFGGDALDPVEVIVSKLGGTSFGAILDNINRWRGQVGLPPVTNENDQPKQPMQLAGNPAVFFDLSGPGTAESPNQRMLLVMTMVNNDVWFFKMIGEQQVVASEIVPPFISFLSGMATTESIADDGSTIANSLSRISWEKFVKLASSITVWLSTASALVSPSPSSRRITPK